jgi:hypothetical protein
VDFSELQWLVLIVVAAVEAIKQGTKLAGEWCILVSVVLGLGLIFGLEFAPYYTMLAIKGVVIGLAGSGSYSLAKRGGGAVLGALNGRG